MRDYRMKIYQVKPAYHITQLNSWRYLMPRKKKYWPQVEMDFEGDINKSPTKPKGAQLTRGAFDDLRQYVQLIVASDIEYGIVRSQRLDTRAIWGN